MDQMSLIDPRAHQIEAEIELLHHRYFSIQRRDQKLSMQKKLKDLRGELARVLSGSLGSSIKGDYLSWDPFDSQSGSKFFEPFWMFGKELEKGFDIVIGNPPYVLLQDGNSTSEQNSFYREQFQVASYKLDLYHLFIEQGNRLLKVRGVLSYLHLQILSQTITA